MTEMSEREIEEQVKQNNQTGTPEEGRYWQMYFSIKNKYRVQTHKNIIAIMQTKCPDVLSDYVAVVNNKFQSKRRRSLR